RRAVRPVPRDIPPFSRETLASAAPALARVSRLNDVVLWFDLVLQFEPGALDDGPRVEQVVQFEQLQYLVRPCRSARQQQQNLVHLDLDDFRAADDAEG